MKAGSSKPEIRSKPEARNPKSELARKGSSDFGFRISFGFRTSAFGFAAVA
jgi:hypothetical protein